MIVKVLIWLVGRDVALLTGRDRPAETQARQVTPTTMGGALCQGSAHIWDIR